MILIYDLRPDSYRDTIYDFNTNLNEEKSEAIQKYR